MAFLGQKLDAEVCWPSLILCVLYDLPGTV